MVLAQQPTPPDSTTYVYYVVYQYQGRSGSLATSALAITSDRAITSGGDVRKLQQVIGQRLADEGSPVPVQQVVITNWILLRTEPGWLSERGD